MSERCEHCRRELRATEPAFLIENQTRAVCGQCAETSRRRGGIILRPDIKTYGVTEADYEEKRATLTDMLGRWPNHIEVITALYDDLLKRAGSDRQRGSLNNSLAVEYQVAGLDPFPFKQESKRCELKAKIGKYVRILGGRCDGCKAQDGRILTVQEALSEMPLPCPRCTFGVTETEPYPWCVCLYVAHRMK